MHVNVGKGNSYSIDNNIHYLLRLNTFTILHRLNGKQAPTINSRITMIKCHKFSTRGIRKLHTDKHLNY